MTQWGLDTLFNPGKRHMDDEKRRLQSTREEVGDSSGGRRIDLESGRVAISVNRGSAVSLDHVDDSELEAALPAEDILAVALSSDETEIEPALAEESGRLDDAEVAAPEVVPELPSEQPVAEDVPIAAPNSEPAGSASPRKKALSASAWSRRG